MMQPMTTTTTASTDLPIPVRANRQLVAAMVLLHAGILAGLPFLLTHSVWWAWLLPALAWVHATHWALIHEGIHKLLHPDTATNERMGRLLGVLMGASFHVLRFGHLMHHKLNRDWHSEWVPESSLVRRGRYYAHLLFGLYGSEVLTGALIAILPRETAIRLARRTALKYHPDVAIAAERFFYTRGHVAHVRRDMAASALLFTAPALHFGAFWPFLVAFIGMRALVISLLDNVYHYATPEDNSKAGKELLLRPLYSAAILHGNYHETHHLNPDVPWTSLPHVHSRQERIFNGHFASHTLQQFAGPLQSRQTRPLQHQPAPAMMPAGFAMA